MNKLLVTIAAAGLGALAFGPAVVAQDSSSEAPAMASGNENHIDTVEFEKADIDKSGELSFDEAVSLIPSLTQEQFDQLDGNDNGTLSLAEIGDTPQNGSILSPATSGSSESSSEPDTSSSSAQ